ncbi:formylglycine-generating enzyme family protein [uncultured Nostoc sp.]|uniref:formylglycine-generating enzyme family protein n=1 Tax=uncultured Nostoc sp. TaxID=340711 RepID=UPI0035C9E440
MDTGTEANNLDLDWLKPDVLIHFIDELREAGYKIGIAQYIAAQNLILILLAQGETLDNPKTLRNLLGPIFCSSPIEQEDFQQRFDYWVKLFSKTNLVTENLDVEAKVLSEELATERTLYSQMQRLIVLATISIFISILSILLSASHTNKKPFIQPSSTLPPTSVDSIPTPTGVLPTVPLRQLPSKTNTEPSTNLSFTWQILLLLLTFYIVVVFIWRLWWLWRAKLFLQRHSTTQQPDLQTISITGFEENLVSSLVLLKIARNFRYRIRIPAREIDVERTIDATLRNGGWLTPIYRNYQVLPEYLFLINRASYRDHQAKFVEEIIQRLRNEGVFITIYFFDDDPRICFPDSDTSLPLKLREIISQYSQHSLVIISDTSKFFSTITGELEPWVNQLNNWENRAILTSTPVQNWGKQEFSLAQQFMILPATIKGLEILSQRLSQRFAIDVFTEEMQIPLPYSLQKQPYHWIERNPPPTEQINAMLDSLEKYLGQNSFYWLSACAVFPDLDWNITIYLGNVLKTQSGKSLIEVCSLTDLARLPWFRYGYIPNWLRVYLISTLTPEQQQIIRNALQNLLITSVQGSTSKFQLEIAKQYHSLLPKLANPILNLLSKKAAIDSPLRDYIFLGFMKGQSLLAMQVSDEFSRSLQRQKRNYWWMQGLRKLGIKIKPTIHQPSFTQSANSTLSLINRRQFLQWLGWGGAGLLASVVAHQVTQKSSQNLNLVPNSNTTPLQNFNFETVRVNTQGRITARAVRTAQYFVEDLGNGVTLQMVAIPGGSFVMGSPAAEARRSDDESPQHNVTVNPFFMGRYEITQAQYQAIMGNNPANFKGDTRPVETVTWNDAVKFCQKLSQRTRRNYRLPSEAEWEYACRAGTTTPFYFGETITADLVSYNATQANASAPTGQYRQQTTPVGSFLPNAFGLYDMHGNVWEWCQDTWHDNYNGAPTDGNPWINESDNTYRLLRGGSWNDNPVVCRCAYRGNVNRVIRGSNFGFRVVCDGGVVRR